MGGGGPRPAVVGSLRAEASAPLEAPASHAEQAGGALASSAMPREQSVHELVQPSLTQGEVVPQPQSLPTMPAGRPLTATEAQASWKIALMGACSIPDVTLEKPLTISLVWGEGVLVQVRVLRTSGQAEVDFAWVAAVQEAARWGLCGRLSWNCCRECVER